MAIKREYGKEQPYIPLGPFKLRLPFIHYKIEMVELIQGMVLVAIPLGGAAQMMDAVGLPWELALPMCAWFAIIVCLHPTLGDPLFPGYITPAIPLVTAYILQYDSGPSRIKALMAVQLMLAFLFGFMAVTKLANKFMKFVPNAIKGGILLGAGISSFITVIQVGGRLEGRAISSLIGAAIVFIILYSARFARIKPKYKILKFISNYGLLVGLFAGLIIGPLIGELSFPKPEWGFTNLGKITEVIKGYSIFAIGVPELSYWIKGFPMALTAYIIAFGDFVLAETIVKDTDEARQDEYVEFNPVRSNLICCVRNTVLGLICPYVTLAGPIWAGGVIVTAERYKQGRETMDSFYDGMGSYTIGMALATCLTIFTSLLKPVMQLAMILCLTVQGYACGYISMESLKSKEEIGIAILMAVTMSIRGTTIGLITGVLLVIVIGNSVVKNKKKSEEDLKLAEE